MTPQDYSNSLICKEVGVLLRNYNTTINIIDGLLFRQRDAIRMIEFYTNSKYLNGMKDELGRDKPFYNIVNAMCDVENAAKDIDTKNIRAVSDDGQHYVGSFLLSKDIYEWMKESDFAKTLNDMRDTHTRYGSLLVKKCYEKDEEDGTLEMKVEIPEWKNLITDQVDILGSPIIECHYMTPVELMSMTSWENVDEVISSALTRGYSARIPVYEVRGNFPLSFFKQAQGKKWTKKDERTFSYQLYYLGGQYGQTINFQTQSATSLFSLQKLTPMYWENDTEKVYKYLARKKRAGRAFGVGVVEEGEEAQVWTNDAVLKQFRAMEFTTKVVGQTASKKLKGRNMLNEVDDGQILEHEDGKPITTVQLLPAGGLGQYSGLLAQWFTQFERATSAYSAQRGESPTSRTSAKLQQTVLSQSSSVMQNIKEELGIFISEIFEDWVMPYLSKKLNAEHILSHEFTLDELKEIDRNFAINVANAKAKEKILSGEIVSAEEYASYLQSADQSIKQTKATRFLTIPKDYYKQISAKITFLVTDEQKDTQAIIGSLMEIMKIYNSNPQLIDDPVMTELLMQIIELSGVGISPVNIVAAIQEKARAQAEAAKTARPAGKVSQSINFKDLPPDGQKQMAAEVGIDIQPQQTAAVPPAVPGAAPAPTAPMA